MIKKVSDYQTNSQNNLYQLFQVSGSNQAVTSQMSELGCQKVIGIHQSKSSQMSDLGCQKVSDSSQVSVVSCQAVSGTQQDCNDSNFTSKINSTMIEGNVVNQ